MPLKNSNKLFEIIANKRFLDEGKRLQEADSILKLEIENCEETTLVKSVIVENNIKVDCKIVIDPNSNIISQECSCNLRKGCQHIAATLFEYSYTKELSNCKTAPTLDSYSQWMEGLKQEISKSKSNCKSNCNNIYFRLSIKSDRVIITPLIAKKQKFIPIGRKDIKLIEADSCNNNLFKTFLSTTINRSDTEYTATITGIDFIKQIICSGKALYKNSDKPLKVINDLKAEFSWRTNSNAELYIKAVNNHAYCIDISINNRIYFDNNGGCGVLLFPESITYDAIANKNLFNSSEAKNITDKISNEGFYITPPPQITVSSFCAEKVSANIILKNIRLDECNRFSGYAEPKISKTKSRSTAAIEVYFNYGKYSIPYSESHGNEILHKASANKFLSVERDLPFERKLMDSLFSVGLIGVNELNNFSNLDKFSVNTMVNNTGNECDFWYSFIFETIPELNKRDITTDISANFIYFPQLFNNIKIAIQKRKHSYVMSFFLTTDSVDLNITPSLTNILNYDAIRQIPESEYTPISINNKKYFVDIPAIRKCHEFLTSINETDGFSLHKHEITFSIYNRHTLQIVLDYFLPPLFMVDIDKSTIITQSLKNNLEKIKNDIFCGKLRPYQQEGVSWLDAIARKKTGGLLADDMGLGKTIQILAHISNQKTANQITHPCLIISPASLIHNWSAEINDFTPSLSTITYYGTDRILKQQYFSQTDIIITSYTTFLKDYDFFIEKNFHLLVLDESQNIKNKDATISKLIKTLSAEYRLCLTGTPIENHLGELWSQFDFLLPGLLGNYSFFNRNFKKPAATEKNDNYSQIRYKLLETVSPYYLRRTKDNVLKELPPKNIITRRITLNEQQYAIYNKTKNSVRNEINHDVLKKQRKPDSINILSKLLRLRQICCHPVLADKQLTQAESSKLNYLLELLTTLLSEKHRILVYSQFASMLEIITKALSAKAIKSIILTGKSKDREKLIQQFRKGKADIFLISLKAGGVGLNLTEADTVIHYDPWWNPAAEAQATDRAYRIGQKKHLLCYKLIAADTIEDKIISMQNSKSSLASMLEKRQITQSDIEMLLK